MNYSKNSNSSVGVILKDFGSVTALEAKIKAESEYEVYRKIQDKLFVSDFDREVKRLKGE